MNEYGIRLTRPIGNPADRRRFAETLGPQLKLDADRVEKLLAKTGNLIKGAGRERIERMAAIFEASGVSVHVVELEAEPSSKNTGIRAPVAAVVREATRTVPPKHTRATSSRAPAAATWDNPAPSLPATGILAAPIGRPADTAARQGPPSSVLPPREPDATGEATVAESLAALRARVARQTGMANPTQSASTAYLESTDVAHQTSVDLTPLATVFQPDANATSSYSTDAASREWRETQARQGRWLSLRWKLVGLTMLPLVAASGAWMFSVFTKGANEARMLVVQGAIQTAQVFGDSIGADITVGTDADGVAARAAHLAQSQLLPLKFVVVTDATGRPVVTAENTDSPDAGTVEGWRGRHPEASSALQSMVPQTLSAPQGGSADAWPSPENPFAQPVTAAEGTLILAAQPLPGKNGATVLGLDANAMAARVSENATSSLIQLGAVLLGTALLGWGFASGLIRRLVGLSKAANRVSMGAMSEVIEADGNDEITDLAESVERMRASLEAALTRL